VFKLVLSGLLGLVATAVVLIAGIVGGVRPVTAAVRCFLSFLTAGVLAYIVLFLLEYNNIVNFDNYNDLLPDGGEKQDDNAETGDDAANTEGTDSEQKEPENKEGFKPLSENDYEHMESPDEAQGN